MSFNKIGGGGGNRRSGSESPCVTLDGLAWAYLLSIAMERTSRRDPSQPARAVVSGEHERHDVRPAGGQRHQAVTLVPLYHRRRSRSARTASSSSASSAPAPAPAGQRRSPAAAQENP